MSSSGQKGELIGRIIQHYEGLRAESAVVGSGGDPRSVYFSHIEELASRDLKALRAQGVIDKDIQCERYFEEATHYALERYLGHRPLQLSGTDHADGVLAHRDKLVLWDNKSKEGPVNLKDHIRQFDKYIQSSKKPVAGFLVIGPSYTEESARDAMKYKIEHDIPIALLTAADLKEIALTYEKKGADEPFPLANFIQTGRIDRTTIVL